MKKPLFVFLGSLSLALGIIGIVVPGLPTTSFVLLAAYLYARSSEKLYSKLLNHKFLGGYIRDFQKFKEYSSQPITFRNLNLVFYNEFLDYMFNKAI